MSDLERRVRTLEDVLSNEVGFRIESERELKRRILALEKLSYRPPPTALFPWWAKLRAALIGR